MKRGLIAAAVIAAIAAILFFSIRGGNDKGEKVYVEPASTRTIEAIVTAPGQVDPKVKVNLSAHVVAKIEKLYFVEGDFVRKGQKLVDLERQTYVAFRNRATADVANRKIEVTRAKAALGTAQHNYDRAQAMQRQGIQAQDAFERARLELDNARAAYASALEGVRQGEAGLLQANDDLSRTTIVAPMDGQIVQLNAHEGEVVVTGTMNNPGSVIAVLADLSQVLVEAEVGETEVVGIRVGQQAKVRVDAIPDKEYHAAVAEIGSSAAVRQNAGSGIRYFKVKVAFTDADERLRPGMTAQVSIVTKTAQNIVAVPIQSVVERVPGSKGDDEDSDKPKKKYVFVVKDGKASMIEVDTGISDATHVEVTRGLKAGESVVTGPFRTLKKLHDGDSVNISKEDDEKSSGKKKESDDA